MNVNSTLTCKLWSGGERGTRWHPQKVRTGQTDILVCAVSVCTLATGPLAFTNGANPVKIKRCPETNCPITRAAPCSDSELCCKHYNWWLVCSAEKSWQNRKRRHRGNEMIPFSLLYLWICDNWLKMMRMMQLVQIKIILIHSVLLAKHGHKKMKNDWQCIQKLEQINNLYHLEVVSFFFFSLNREKKKMKVAVISRWSHFK